MVTIGEAWVLVSLLQCSLSKPLVVFITPLCPRCTLNTKKKSISMLTRKEDSYK